MRPEAPEEAVLWWAIVGTYGFFVLGALYPLAPVLAWLLLFAAVAGRLSLGGRFGVAFWRVPVTAAVWVAAMLVMLVALVVAHIDFGLGVAQTVKSAIGWAKGWALMALFVVVGGMRVRAALLARAACVLGAQTLLVLPLTVAGLLAGLPEVLYVSPLQAVGGPGPEFFDVSIYSINPDTGRPRWRLFTPWAPALGFVGAVYFLLCLHERDRRWRLAGLAGCLAMVLASGSRLGLVALPIVLGMAFVLPRLGQPRVLLGLAGASLLAGWVGSELLDAFEQAQQAFHAARPESSRVRAILARIAVDRWADEAPLWGHGVVERGPHLVEYMPIGSHHSWYGLLFVKGAVGFAALALPFAWTLAALLLRPGPLATAALRVLLLLFLYSFGENLEMLAYLFWPGLVLIGIALFGPSPLRPLSRP